MHELSIIKNIFPVIENVAKENHLKIINKVFLKVGESRQIVFEFLQFAFTTIAKNTIAKDAELVIEPVPVTACCKNCQQQFTVKKNVYICLYCDSVDLEILTGKEIVLEGVEGEI